MHTYRVPKLFKLCWLASPKPHQPVQHVLAKSPRHRCSRWR